MAQHGIQSSYQIADSCTCRKPQLQLQAAVLLLCIITNLWGMDSAQVLLEDIGALDGTGQGGGTADHDPVNEVVKLLHVDTDTKASDTGVQPCWKTENFVTQGPCQECDEHAMKYASYCCNETGFRQLIRCEVSQSPVYKSCPKTRWALEKSFWTFEGVMLAVGMSSFIVVMFRRRALDWEALKRVRKQIANSV